MLEEGWIHLLTSCLIIFFAKSFSAKPAQKMLSSGTLYQWVCEV